MYRNVLEMWKIFFEMCRNLLPQDPNFVDISSEGPLELISQSVENSVK